LFSSLWLAAIKVHYRLIHQQNIFFSKKRGTLANEKQNTVESLLSTAERNPPSPLSCRSQRRLLTTFLDVFSTSARSTRSSSHRTTQNLIPFRPPCLIREKNTHAESRERKRREKEKGKDKSEQHLWLVGAGRVVSCVCGGAAPAVVETIRQTTIGSE
jgi:hypothetical protein